MIRSFPDAFESLRPRPSGYTVIAPGEFADFAVECLRVLYSLDHRHMDN